MFKISTSIKILIWSLGTLEGSTRLSLTAPAGGPAATGTGAAQAAIQAAKRKKVDAYITSDLKYHDFYEGNQSFLVVDAGHYETEQHTKKLILNYLTEKLPNFAILLSEVDTNPIKYL